MLNYERVDASWFARPAARAILTEAETDYRERRTFARPTRMTRGISIRRGHERNEGRNQITPVLRKAAYTRRISRANSPAVCLRGESVP